jgi:hypothetical protein
MAKSKLDPDAIIERAKTKPRRAKASFTFDTDIYTRFQLYCKKKDVPISRVLEELMKELITTD